MACAAIIPPHTVSYTWECVQKLKAGDKVVCTQPPMPFKCPGAPQKIIYLIADRLRRRGILKDCKLDFFTHAPAIFGVPYFARALVKVANRYGIGVHYQQNLVAVDGPAKTATFEFVGDNRKGEKETVAFDLLHVSPPQSPHDDIKASPLVNAAGWVEVNQATLQHVRFANIYSLGDVCSTPNSKTAAAVRKQAPVVANEILTSLAGKLIPGAYDGYASCPLTTGIRQNHPGGIHLRRQSHADFAAAQPGQGALGRLVDQSHRPAADVLALHA